MDRYEIRLTEKGQKYYDKQINQDDPDDCVRVDILGIVYEGFPVVHGDVTAAKIVNAINKQNAIIYNDGTKYLTKSIIRCLEKGYLLIRLLH